MLISTPNLIAGMLLTAFVIERAIASVAFLFALERTKRDDAAAREALHRTLWRTLFAGSIALAVVYNFDWMRLLETFGVKDHGGADMVLTWLVLVSGTDRLSTFIGAGADKAATTRAKPSVLKLQGTVETDAQSAAAIDARAGA